MPFHKALEIMKEGLSLGFETLHLTGGEVLLYPQLFDVLHRAENLGYSSYFINTNGHLLDEEICGKLAEFKGIEISLSLNGPEVLHDAIRGKGAHEAARKGLRAALKQQIPVHIFTLVNKRNLESMPRFASDLFKDYPGIADLTFIQLRSDTEEDPDKLSPADYVSLVRMTALLGLTGLPVQILENPLSTATALKMGYKHLPPSLPISREGRILVFADGRIGDNHSSSLDFGLYSRGKLTEVLSSEEYQSLWAEDKTLCCQCDHRSFCRAGGLMKPSDRAHNTIPRERPFCQKVMALV